MHIRSELEQDDSETLRNAAICRAVLRNRVAKIPCNVQEPTDVVLGFDEDIYVVEPVKTKEAESIGASKCSTEAGGTKLQ